jgi:excisionase family DNA binding protein
MSYQREKYLSPEVFRHALSELSGLSISRAKIYTMLEDRKIRALKIGSHWRIDPNEIDRLPERLIQEEKDIPADYDLPGTLDSPENKIFSRKERISKCKMN